MRQELPERFLEEMRGLLGEEADAYLASFDAPPAAGLRVNTGKWTPEEAGDSAAPETGSAYILTIHEGKFHQVKRMFEALDCRVVYLKRLSMGSLRLDEKLRPGEYRPLTEAELAMLQENC